MSAHIRALQGLRSTFRTTTTRATSRVSAPARTQLAVGRRYASGGGHGHAEPTSDIPWMIGGAAVTIPSCWYLWPEAHAESGHHGHDEHADESHSEDAEHAEEDAPKEESAEGEEQDEEKDVKEGEAEKTGDEKDSESEKSPKDQQEQGKEPGESSASGKPSGSQGEGQDAGAATPSEDSKPKEGGGSGVGKGNVKADSDGASESRKSEPDNKGGRKTRVDSGLQKDLGASDETHEEGQGGTKQEKAATSKPPAKGKEGEITGKQFGLSNTPTRHSHQIDEDPEKSKKAEGGPDTAKVMGTVDPNRPAV
ncbi:hypothetical protein LTR62_000279 [Meristemomyces frigidus]|uniref:Uncharacterized protein n=1 Tax=Meristemomyces frigidus TaxID=1508187 RepID=A0AAN7YT06_9PEZI|nr:hypothetical protein LTR62_000279 [Meristemomyces frigidus]